MCRLDWETAADIARVSTRTQVLDDERKDRGGELSQQVCFCITCTHVCLIFAHVCHLFPTCVLLTCVLYGFCFMFDTNV